MAVTRAGAIMAAAKAVSKSHENEKRRKSAARTCKLREHQSAERRSEIRQTDLMGHTKGCACLSEERHEVRSADRSDGACRGACMSVREATKRKTAD